MIITIGSIKGGVGKSTVATNLAAYFANQGTKTTLLDADFQRTSFNWWNDRQESPTAYQHPINSLCESNDLVAIIKQAQDTSEVVLIDCQGRDSMELRSALVTSDVFITPFRPSQADVDTLYILDTFLADALELNPTLKAFGLVSIAPTGKRNEIEVSSAMEAVRENVTHIHCLESALYDRKAYRDALGTGRSVLELKGVNLLAPIEFQKFIDEVNQLCQ